MKSCMNEKLSITARSGHNGRYIGRNGAARLKQTGEELHADEKETRRKGNEGTVDTLGVRRKVTEWRCDKADCDENSLRRVENKYLRESYDLML